LSSAAPIHFGLDILPEHIVLLIGFLDVASGATEPGFSLGVVFPMCVSVVLAHGLKDVTVPGCEEIGEIGAG
jgi:hypothetical protein